MERMISRFFKKSHCNFNLIFKHHVTERYSKTSNRTNHTKLMEGTIREAS
jgi:hypothetical protein